MTNRNVSSTHLSLSTRVQNTYTYFGVVTQFLVAHQARAQKGGGLVWRSTEGSKRFQYFPVKTSQIAVFLTLAWAPPKIASVAHWWAFLQKLLDVATMYAHDALSYFPKS